MPDNRSSSSLIQRTMRQLSRPEPQWRSLARRAMGCARRAISARGGDAALLCGVVASAGRVVRDEHAFCRGCF